MGAERSQPEATQSTRKYLLFGAEATISNKWCLCLSPEAQEELGAFHHEHQVVLAALPSGHMKHDGCLTLSSRFAPLRRKALGAHPDAELSTSGKGINFAAGPTRLRVFA